MAAQEVVQIEQIRVLAVLPQLLLHITSAGINIFSSRPESTTEDGPA